MRIEGETFAYAALAPLLDGEFDIIHCLEQEVCNVVYAHRHIFRQPPKILWSNGGAIPAADQPRCDFVQEHSAYNLRHSRRGKAFVIPHGVDTKRFHPGVSSNFRVRYGIPSDAFLAISVGTICYWHKRMDYVIREMASLPGAWLLIVGQESADSPAIKALGQELMGERIVFATLPHDALPQAYAAADVFVLGSLHETFGIAYIEAMAMGLPVICTNHPNQRSIVQEGVFIQMDRPGALGNAIRGTSRKQFAELGQRGLAVARRCYDLDALKPQYLEWYRTIAASKVLLPQHTIKSKVAANLRNAINRPIRLFPRF